MQDLIIEISDLAGVPGATKQIVRSHSFEGLGGPLARLAEDGPVELDLAAESFSEGVVVSGLAAGRLQLSCARCLADFEQRFERRVDEAFYFSPSRAAEAEGYTIQDMTVDLEPMLRDVIVLGLPVNPLHSSDCRGLCKVCGADLNHEDCGHSRETSDLRWAPLKAILATKLES